MGKIRKEMEVKVVCQEGRGRQREVRRTGNYGEVEVARR